MEEIHTWKKKYQIIGRNLFLIYTASWNEELYEWLTQLFPYSKRWDSWQDVDSFMITNDRSFKIRLDTTY